MKGNAGGQGGPKPGGGQGEKKAAGGRPAAHKPVAGKAGNAKKAEEEPDSFQAKLLALKKKFKD